ncbi:hypothetical protein AB0B07_22025 [Streptomyces sioyaensis]|uniref:hypothetical protein n=1 Tax=Streptomyces sioyaensis TaxID=67364 RepID=UPI0033C398D2
MTPTFSCPFGGDASRYGDEEEVFGEEPVWAVAVVGGERFGVLVVVGGSGSSCDAYAAAHFSQFPPRPQPVCRRFGRPRPGRRRGFQLPVARPRLLDEDLRAVLLVLLLVSLGDDRVSPASPLGFEGFLLPVPVFGFRSETGAGETLPHRIPAGRLGCMARYDLRDRLADFKTATLLGSWRGDMITARIDLITHPGADT